MRSQRPTPAEMGLEVTIAIVAMTGPHGHFICVSDQMISFDDVTQADESGLVKLLPLSFNWTAAFSANNINNIFPILHAVQSKIAQPEKPLDLTELQNYFTTSISEAIQSDFFNSRVARYGYKNLAHFRQEGRADLGDHFFVLCRELGSGLITNS